MYINFFKSYQSYSAFVIFFFSISLNVYTKDSANLISISNEAHYTTMLASGKPTVLEFYADWCGACRKAKPKIEKMAMSQEYSHINFLLINIDVIKNLASKYAVKAYPTFVVLDANNDKVATIEGFNQGSLESALAQLKPAEKKSLADKQMNINEKKQPTATPVVKKTTANGKEKSAEKKQPASIKEFASGEVIELNSMAHFEELKSKKQPMLLDFYTTWCGPCKMLKPMLIELAREYSDVLFVTIDAEKLCDLANKHSVTSYPTLIVLDKNGQKIDMLKGYFSDNMLLKNMLNKATGKKGTMMIIKEEKEIVRTGK